MEVKGGVDLKLEEIIARWQQNREAQKQKLENYLASSFMSLHFEGTNLGPGFDVSMRLRQFFSRDGQTEIAQKEFYVNGVKFGKNHEFPLPQIEPEKVLTQPLELKLNERYDIQAAGHGANQRSHVLRDRSRAQGKVRDEALYSGKIWIDGTTFREVKQYLSQRGAKNNVLVNTETQNFELVGDDKGNQFNLLRSISAQQLLNAAGRDFVLQRTVQFSNYVINTPEFSGDLAAERSSDDPMYRDTDQGLRSLKKKGDERVLVETSTKRITSLIGGAMYGGTFNFPIPFLGISIADFDFRHTGAQLSTFFAGPHPGFGSLEAVPAEVPSGAGFVSERAAGREPHLQRQHGVDARGHMDMGANRRTAGLLATHHPSQPDGDRLTLPMTTSSGPVEADEQYELPRNGLTVLPGVEVKYNRKGYVFDAHKVHGVSASIGEPFGCTSLDPPPTGCGSTSLNPPPQNTLVVAAFAKRIHALQRRLEQGLLHRKVHQGRMGYLLLGWKPDGSLLALLPVVSCVAATSRHSPRHRFF